MNSIITDRTVLPSPQSVSAMEKIIGYSFQNKRLLEEALTHPSYADSRSYQRLEFFGDAALGLAVSQHIFNTYPCVHSGPLTFLRSAIVSNEKLARVAVRHGFYLHLRLNAPDLQEQVRVFTEAVTGEDETPLVYGGSVKAPKVLANIVESVAAAIYVDLKYDLKELWMIFSRLLEPIVTLKDLQDEPHPVTMLVDLCQKNGKQIYIKQWRDETTSTASVYVDGECFPSGSSEQKKIARLNAAKIALYELSKSMGVDHQSFEVIFGIDGSIHIEEAKQKLYGICGKLKWPRPIYNMEKDEGPSHEKKFASSVTIVTVDGTVLSRRGDVKSRIKDADNSAASLMIWALQESDYLVTLKDLQGQLHPVTMSKSMGLDNRIERDEGPSHEKIFSSLSADQTNKKKESEATMEGLTEGVNNLQITTDSSNKTNRIQVSNTKKPIFFYVNLAKKYMQRNNEVELSAIGMAMSTVVTIAEILKNNGLAFEKRITTSTVDKREDAGGRPIQKAKFEILLGKSDKFDEIMAATAAAAAAEEDIEYEEQS